ncbi:putative Amino acid transporter [Giardia duodenalis]|uniref:Amino acid transporter n=1 Tax=Giardia intestinalis (strain ATCC 50803 / WB clone C6) TaxID=184922 RepID=A8BMH0_GIAIC|nr:putative Amino acid transporter [Giardia intestinalis]KAE8304008.1 putative Amino acid transporter [Giardia intestinalis]|eukprot:XP_001706096.1 Amino acid transporter, putative [Giardia lamblia ATCC 50803]
MQVEDPGARSTVLTEVSVQGAVEDGSAAQQQAAKSAPPKKAGSHLYSYGTMIGIAINYIIGTGALSLSVTMGSAGVLMTVIILIIGSGITLFLAIYFTEVLARAYALARGGFAPEDILNKLHEYENPVSATASAEGSNASAAIGNATIEGGKACNTLSPDYSLSTECEFCISELMKMFYGKPGFYIYQVSNLIYFFGTVWSYGNVVASSLTSIIPMYSLPGSPKTWECDVNKMSKLGDPCYTAYWIWLCIAMVIACILIFFDLSQQKVLQTIFTGCRFATIALVLLFTIVGYSRGPYSKTYSKGNASSAIRILETDIYWIANQFSSIVFCQVCHHSIPEIIRPVKKEHHGKINFGFTITYMVIFVITSLILFMCGSYFGTLGEGLLTLNFGQWHGTDWNLCAKDKTGGAEMVLGYIVRVLPPIYVTTAIPINALTMSNNLLSLFPLRLQKHLALVVFAKLISIIPAMMMAGLVKDLNKIVGFSGLTGFVIISVSALMIIKGRKLCKQHFGDANLRTPFNSWSSHIAIIYTILVITGVGFILTTYSVVADAIGKASPRYVSEYPDCKNNTGTTSLSLVSTTVDNCPYNKK